MLTQPQSDDDYDEILVSEESSWPESDDAPEEDNVEEEDEDADVLPLGQQWTTKIPAWTILSPGIGEKTVRLYPYVVH